MKSSTIILKEIHEKKIEIKSVINAHFLVLVYVVQKVPIVRRGTTTILEPSLFSSVYFDQTFKDKR